jgi:aminoacyl tRNA synthase complex-interacting multifunctional protein 1
MPESVLPPKKKIFETVQPGFTTLSDLSVAWKKPDEEGASQLRLVAKVDGAEVPCKVKSIVGATVR